MSKTISTSFTSSYNLADPDTTLSRRGESC